MADAEGDSAPPVAEAPVAEDAPAVEAVDAPTQGDTAEPEAPAAEDPEATDPVAEAPAEDAGVEEPADSTVTEAVTMSATEASTAVTSSVVEASSTVETSATYSSTTVETSHTTTVEAHTSASVEASISASTHAAMSSETHTSSTSAHMASSQSVVTSSESKQTSEQHAELAAAAEAVQGARGAVASPEVVEADAKSSEANLSAPEISTPEDAGAALEGGEGGGAAPEEAPVPERALAGASPAGDTADQQDAPASGQTTARPTSAPIDDRPLEERPDLLGNYHPGNFKVQAPEGSLELESVTLENILGFESHKHNNIHQMESNTLLTSAGNMVVLLDLTTGEQKYLPGLDGGGIGAVCAHPSKTFFAVAEKSTVTSPRVYIYEYPSLNLKKILRNGTEVAYSAMAFNKEGNMLATVGAYPDFMLTLWRWEDEAVVLRSKAFSQEVFNVKFSPFFDGRLNTSGTGHIRFWKMASTFTGLKLQGEIGKFGAVELSDVADFAEFPDQKVLSSTEYGNLIMWDGGLIKCVVRQPGGKPCHVGPIEVVSLDLEASLVMTAGRDGCVKFWDYDKLNEIEPEEDSHTVDIEPVKVVKLGAGVHIKSLIQDRENDRWIVLDGEGAITKVNFPMSDLKMERLLEFNAGGIVGLATCPWAHFAVTAGTDGSVRLYDYRKKEAQMYSKRFYQPASCMMMLPEHVDDSQRVVLVGFADGMVRVLLRGKSDWKLMGVMKPHKKAVTSIAVSPDGKMLASASKDGSIFFFTVQDPVTYTPLAFTVIQAPVNSISFSEDSSSLLLGCESGEVMEMEVPGGEVDNHKTYEVTLPIRYYDFVLPKPLRSKSSKKLAEGKEGEGDDAEGEAPAGGEGEQPAGEVEGEVEGEGAEGEGGNGEREGEGSEDEEGATPEGEDSFAVLSVQYLPGTHGKFLLALSGRAAGKMYECDFEDPTTVVSHPASGGQLSSLRYSHSGRFMVGGSSQGSVRIAQLDSELGRPSDVFWEAPLHDSQRGAVRGAALSFDDTYLLTVSDDGSFYVSEVQAEALRGSAQEGREFTMADVTEAQDAEIEQVADAKEGEVYSIEEAKQKTEEDNLLAAAEQKKLSVREYLDKIRREFEELLKQNAAKPEAQRLPREEFEIDPGLRAMIEEETAKKEEIARKELAWENEKARLMLAKVRKWFLDDVEVERIVLHGFMNRKSVTSFRTRKLSEEMQLEIARVHELIDEENAARVAAAEGGAPGEGGEDGEGGSRSGAGESGEPGRGGGKDGKGGAGDVDADGRKLSKADLRRIARQKREAEWDAFNATKPDRDYENPADVALITEAENNMGDFKLKSDPEYVVPEEERLNTEKKRRQMILLEEGMYNIRMEFNSRFLALRDVKKKVCADIKEKNKRLRELQAALKVSATLFEPEMKGEETPETRDVISEEDLVAYAARLAAETGKEGGGFGGFGGKGGDKATKGTKPGDKAGGAHAAKAHSNKGPKQGGDAGAVPAAPMSDLEKMEAELLRRRNQCEMEKLTGEVADMVDAFDEALSKLRREKLALEADLKQAEIKRLVMYQELQLLKDFEKRENALNDKLTAKKAEKKEVVEKIRHCQESLDQKKSEIDKLIEHKKAVAVEFDELVDDQHNFREPLLKIFMRKIKRSKKAQGDSDDEDYDSDAEDDEDDEDEDFDDDDEDEEVCPPGCDQVLYEKVCDIREKRLDQEDVIVEFQKGIDNLKKEKEQYSKKQKVVEGSLQKINQDIIEFQKEKQGKLNEIDVVVTLSMHQMEYLVDGKLPYDLSQALVFSNTELEKLKSRIKELDQEKVALRRQQQELRKEHQQLLRDKKAKEARIAELDARAYNVQMLKFGQEIDLELLDRIGTTRGAEELQEQLKAQSATFAQELRQWDRKIEEAQEQMLALTADNTQCLQTVTKLSKQQKSLESKLTTTQTSLFNDPVARRRKEIAERDRLVQEVNAQAKDINALKAQIAVLRRKDTSMYE